VRPEKGGVFLEVLQVPAFHFDDVAVAVHVSGGTDKFQNPVGWIAYLTDLKIYGLMKQFHDRSPSILFQNRNGDTAA